MCHFGLFGAPFGTQPRAKGEGGMMDEVGNPTVCHRGSHGHSKVNKNTRNRTV